MRKLILRFYLTVRKPRNFLKIVSVFISSSLLLHWFRGYDADWGSTNLILSIDATIASTVMLMVQEEGAERMDRMLAAILALTESARDRDFEQLALMRAMKEADDRLLKALTEKEE